jgi:hypothetical protein
MLSNELIVTITKIGDHFMQLAALNNVLFGYTDTPCLEDVNVTVQAGCYILNLR